MNNPRRFYIWVFPLIWTGCSILSWQWPGDEYGLYVKSSMIGIWGYIILRYLAPYSNDPNNFPANILFPLSFAVAGALLMAGMGYLMDRLCVRRMLWAVSLAVSIVVLFMMSIYSYESVRAAISKNGSLWAYLFYSINMGLYLSIPLSLLARSIERLFNPKRN